MNPADLAVTQPVPGVPDDLPPHVHAFIRPDADGRLLVYGLEVIGQIAFPGRPDSGRLTRMAVNGDLPGMGPLSAFREASSDGKVCGAFVVPLAELLDWRDRFRRHGDRERRVRALLPINPGPRAQLRAAEEDLGRALLESAAAFNRLLDARAAVERENER